VCVCLCVRMCVCVCVCVCERVRVRSILHHTIIIINFPYLETPEMKVSSSSPALASPALASPLAKFSTRYVACTCKRSPLAIQAHTDSSNIETCKTRRQVLQASCVASIVTPAPPRALAEGKRPQSSSDLEDGVGKAFIYGVCAMFSLHPATPVLLMPQVTCKCM